ncbi:hypothetical protein AB3N62_05855 [Leptospira sp. WS4.C2]
MKQSLVEEILIAREMKNEKTVEIFKVLNYDTVEVLPKPKVGGDINLTT